MTEPFHVVIERVLPYDGPHSADTVEEAVSGLPALVRYLNNATQGAGPGHVGNGQTTLRHVPTVDAVLAGLHAALFGLDQLLSQLADALTRHAGDPALYDDRRDRPGADGALGAAGGILGARDAAMAFADAVTDVRERSVHLGHDVDAGGGVR
ncbi:MAG: hypothetical protein ACRDUA_20290 [Micromonosporaceae bacterium]